MYHFLYPFQPLRTAMELALCCRNRSQRIAARRAMAAKVVSLYFNTYFAGNVNWLPTRSWMYILPVNGIWSHCSFSVIVLFLSSLPWSMSAYLTLCLLNRTCASSTDCIMESQITTWFNLFRLVSYSATTYTNNCFKFQWKAGRKSASKSSSRTARSCPPWFRSVFRLDMRKVFICVADSCKWQCVKG